MIPQSAAATIARIESGSDGFVALGDFIDQWRRTPADGRAHLLLETPRMEPADRRWLALVAAAADHLAGTSEPPIPVPDWIRSRLTVLDEPWFLLPGTSLQMHQLVDTPAAFKSRNIFGGDRILSRV